MKSRVITKMKKSRVVTKMKKSRVKSSVRVPLDLV